MPSLTGVGDGRQSVVSTLPSPRGLTLLWPEDSRTQRHLYGEALLLVPQAAVGPQQALEALPHLHTLLQVRGPQPGAEKGDPQKSGIPSFNQRSSLSSPSELGKLLWQTPGGSPTTHLGEPHSTPGGPHSTPRGATQHPWGATQNTRGSHTAHLGSHTAHMGEPHHNRGTHT